MNRRQMILAALASILTKSAAAQQSEDSIAPVKGAEEFWDLLTALDAFIFCMAVAVLKAPPAVFQARRELQPYSSQFSDAKAVDAFNSALKSSDGQARVEQ